MGETVEIVDMDLLNESNNAGNKDAGEKGTTIPKIHDVHINEQYCSLPWAQGRPPVPEVHIGRHSAVNSARSPSSRTMSACGVADPARPVRHGVRRQRRMGKKKGGHEAYRVKDLA